MACGQEVGVWAKETIGPLRRFGEEGVEDDSWREAWDQREVLSNLYEEVFCELRRLKKNSRKRADARWRAGPFLGASRKEGWVEEEGYMHKCGGWEDRRGRRRPIDGAEGWCEEEAESLAEGHGTLEGRTSAALSVHRPPCQSPTKPCSLCPSHFLPSPPGPSYDTPSHRCSSMDAVFSPAHPPPHYVSTVARTSRPRVSHGHLHLATGKMASTSMTILEFLRSCVFGFLKIF